MGWCLTKSHHGFDNLFWFLSTYATYDVGEISVYQLKDEYTEKRSVRSYCMDLKRGYLKLVTFEGCWYSIIGGFETPLALLWITWEVIMKLAAGYWKKTANH